MPTARDGRRPRGEGQHGQVAQFEQDLKGSRIVTLQGWNSRPALDQALDTLAVLLRSQPQAPADEADCAKKTPYGGNPYGALHWRSRRPPNL